MFTFKKLITFFAVFTMSILVLVALAGFSVGHAHGLMSFANYIKSNIAWVSAVKYSVMAVAIWSYPAFVRGLYAHKRDSNPELVAKYTRRRYIVLFFIICETMITHNLLANFIGYLLSL